MKSHVKFALLCLLALSPLFLVCAVEIPQLFAQPPSPPGAPQVASGTITVLVNGQPVATGGVLNFISGISVTASAHPDIALGGTDIEFDANTAALLSRATDQSGVGKYCVAANSVGNVLFTCTLNPKLTVLTPGMVLTFTANTSTQPGQTATLYVDNIGTLASIMQKDGTTAAPIVAGYSYLLMWDGVVWRVLA